MGRIEMGTATWTRCTLVIRRHLGGKALHEASTEIGDDVGLNNRPSKIMGGFTFVVMVRDDPIHEGIPFIRFKTNKMTCENTTSRHFNRRV